MNKSHRNALQSNKTLWVMIIPLLIVFCLSSVSSFSTNQFNDSSTSGTLIFDGVNNVTKYLSVPNTVSKLISGKFNISGWTTSQNPIYSNAIAYYQFENNLLDNSTYNNNLLSGSNTFVTSIKKLGSYSRNYTGSTQDSNSTSTNFGFGTGQFTIAFWMYAGSFSGSIIKTDTGFFDRGDTWAIRVASGTLRFERNGNIILFNSTSGLLDSSWHRIVITRNSTNGLTMYLDGQPRYYNASDTTNFAYSNLVIGGGGAEGYYSGYLDDIILNKAYSWTSTQVTADYNSGSGLTYSYIQPSSNATLNLDGTIINLPQTNGTSEGTNITINNIVNYINNYISTCSYIGIYCNVPFIFYSNTTGNLTYSALSFDDIGFIENNQSYNLTSYETKTESYQINLTYNNNSYTATAYLVYNGTEYLASQSGSGNTINFYKSFDIPLTNNTINNSIYWKIGLTNSTGITYYNSSFKSQIVNPLTFNLCNSTLNVPYMNITFKDESSLNNINAGISLSTWNYYLGNGNIFKTLTFINTTVNPSYAFCLNPPDVRLYTNLSLQYLNSTAPQRIYNPSLLTLTNTTTNQVLYLLGTSSGIYVTVQVINTADQLLSGVDIKITRDISGSSVIVGQGTTGSDGSYTFWLNPDFSHNFNLTKLGYTEYTTDLIPTQSSYTFTLGGSSIASNNSYQGINYIVSPNLNYLNNDTEYTFSFYLTSSYWDVSNYGFNLRLKNNTIVGSDNTGTEGTNLTANYNVNNQTIIYLDYYWTINDVTYNATKIYSIINTDNTGWSIMTLFNDIEIYLDSGVFGLDEFGRYIIIFLILFFSVGVLSYKYGLTSPLAISSMIFGIVYFFDVVVGLMPNINGIPHVLTFLSAAILIVVIFKEVQS